MLSVSDVASKISNPGPVWFLPPPPPPRERLFASSKGHYSELSQTWEGSEPIHIRFSPPSHAWEVLKYFLKYLLAARSEDNGFSMALLTQNGKRCRHCEVQTRHSDLDSNESDPGTGHWSQVWLHLHLQLNGHPQIYWMTSTVCCLATKHGQKIRGMDRKGDGKTTWQFFLNILLFFLHCWFFDLVLLGHKNNVRSRNIIFNYYSNGQTGGGTFILKYIFCEISLRSINNIRIKDSW